MTIQTDMQFEPQSNVVEMPPCEYCEGNGVVLKTNPKIQVGQDGWSKVVPCLHCKEGRNHAKRLFEKRFGDTGMPQSYKEYRLRHFKELPEHQLEGKKRAIGAACVFCDNFPAPFSSQEIFEFIGENFPHNPMVCHSLAFCGDYGVGKTALASAIANTLVIAGVEVVFVKLMELIKKVQSGYSTGNSDEIIEAAQNAKLLILDECNLNNYSDDRKEILERIIYYRNNHQKPYILTMNIDQREFEDKWGGRIAARVNQDCHWFVFGGDVLRPKSTMF